MTGLVIALIFLVIVLIVLLKRMYDYFINRLDEKTDGDEASIPEVSAPTVESRDRDELLAATLLKMGCVQEKIAEGLDGVEYQSGYFLIEAKDAPYVRIYMMNIHSFSKYDIDEYARVKQVVNALNSFAFCSLYYKSDDEADEVYISMADKRMLPSDMAGMEDALRNCFHDLFVTQHEFYKRLAQQEVQETANR